MATSWNGGTAPAKVVSSASVAHRSTALPPIKVARATPDAAVTPRRSIHMLAAVDREGRAGDETGVVGDEE